MDDSPVALLKSKLFLASLSDKPGDDIALSKIAEWRGNADESSLSAAEPLIFHFLSTQSWPPEKTASYSVADLAAALGDSSPIIRGQADEKRTAQKKFLDPNVSGRQSMRSTITTSGRLAMIRRYYLGRAIIAVNIGVSADDREAKNLARQVREYEHLIVGPADS